MEFCIDTVEKINDKYKVTGAINRGWVKTGLVFTKSFKRKILRGNDGEFLPEEDYDFKEISARVEKIITYGNEYNELDEGITAILELNVESENCLETETIISD